MTDLAPVYGLLQVLLPFECLRDRFMQEALLGLLLLAPMAAAMGVQVVNLRMSFFSDAVSHSAFAGVALGLIFSLDPHWAMPLFGLAVGMGIMALIRQSSLSSDTVTGVFFSAVVAFGLLVISRERAVARDVQRFLFGDILTIGDGDIFRLFGLFAAIMAFQAYSFNRMLYVGLSPVLARAHNIRVALYQYTYAALLSLVVMYSVWAVGVLLVTALLVVPAAAARNLARSAGGMFWWSVGIGTVSAVAGLLISAQEWAGTATGATVVMVSCALFAVSFLWSALRSAVRGGP